MDNYPDSSATPFGNDDQVDYTDYVLWQDKPIPQNEDLVEEENEVFYATPLGNVDLFGAYIPQTDTQLTVTDDENFFGTQTDTQLTVTDDENFFGTSDAAAMLDEDEQNFNEENIFRQDDIMTQETDAAMEWENVLTVPSPSIDSYFGKRHNLGTKERVDLGWSIHSPEPRPPVGFLNDSVTSTHKRKSDSPQPGPSKRRRVSAPASDSTSNYRVEDEPQPGPSNRRTSSSVPASDSTSNYRVEDEPQPGPSNRRNSSSVPESDSNDEREGDQDNNKIVVIPTVKKAFKEIDDERAQDTLREMNEQEPERKRRLRRERRALAQREARERAQRAARQTAEQQQQELREEALRQRHRPAGQAAQVIVRPVQTRPVQIRLHRAEDEFDVAVTGITRESQRVGGQLPRTNRSFVDVMGAVEAAGVRLFSAIQKIQDTANQQTLVPMLARECRLAYTELVDNGLLLAGLARNQTTVRTVRDALTKIGRASLNFLQFQTGREANKVKDSVHTLTYKVRLEEVKTRQGWKRVSADRGVAAGVDNILPTVLVDGRRRSARIRAQ